MNNRCDWFYCKKKGSNICCYYCDSRIKCRNDCLNNPNKCNNATDKAMSHFEIIKLRG